MSLTQPAVEREPRSDFELVLDKCGNQTAGWTLRLGEIAPVAVNHMEKLIILLGEAVETHPCVVTPFDQGDIRLSTSIFRGTVLRGGAGHVVRIAAVVDAVVVEERRDRQHQPRAESADPGEGGERIVLAIDVAQKRGRIARINRHLIKIAARLSDEA